MGKGAQHGLLDLVTAATPGVGMTSVATAPADPLTAAKARTSLSLLDAFELHCDGEPVELPLSAQRLLAFVALHDHRLLRVYVAGKLWSHVSEERAAGNLRSSLWRLHRQGHRLVRRDEHSSAAGARRGRGRAPLGRPRARRAARVGR